MLLYDGINIRLVLSHVPLYEYGKKLPTKVDDKIVAGIVPLNML